MLGHHCFLNALSNNDALLRDEAVPELQRAFALSKSDAQKVYSDWLVSHNSRRKPPCMECGNIATLQYETASLCMPCFGKALDDSYSMTAERGKEFQARLRLNKKMIAEAINNRLTT